MIHKKNEVDVYEKYLLSQSYRTMTFEDYVDENYPQQVDDEYVKIERIRKPNRIKSIGKGGDTDV